MTRRSHEVRALLAGATRSEEIPPEVRARSARRVSKLLTVAPVAVSAWAAWSKVVIAAVVVGSLGGYVAARVKPSRAPEQRAPQMTHPARASRAPRAVISRAVIARGPEAPRVETIAALPSHRAMFRSVERTRALAPSVAPEAPAAVVSSAVAPVSPAISPPVAPPAAAPVDGFVRELALLGEAQSALSRDPEAVLAITARHQREFPRGRLVEESQMLSLDALRRLGRAEALRAQGAGFLSAHPRSAYAARVRAWLHEGAVF